MNHKALIDVLTKLNLKPGIYHCELPEYEIVITVRSRKPCDNEPNAERLPEAMSVDPVIIVDESCIMLDPWVELPTPKPVGTVMAYLRTDSTSLSIESLPGPTVHR